ncbi:MAG: GGDEF domain-containing protein [Gemmataceae bacterium]
MRPLSLILFDIDHFKQTNDDLGHLGGDFTLRELAACVKGNVRKEELFARYGGEEFAIVLPETTLETAPWWPSECALVERHVFQYEGKTYPVTISIGVARHHRRRRPDTARTHPASRREAVPGEEPRPQSGDRVRLAK